LPTIEESLNGKNNGPGRVEIIMEPGAQYRYSGGGFSVLQLIVEEVAGEKFEDYMQADVLNPLGMTSSSYKIDDKIMAASASEYDAFGEAIDFELFTAQAAAGLHVTIEDFTHFAYANLHRHRDHEEYSHVLSGDIIQQMMRPVPQADGRYGYGLGYQTQRIQGTSVLLGGHRGANTGWQAIFNVNPETNDGFIMVTNGGAGHSVYGQVFHDWVLWKTGVSLEEWDSKPPVSNKLKTHIDRNGLDGFQAIYAEWKANQSEDYDFSENQLNRLGFYYMAKDDLEESIAIFELNVEAFPDSFVVYDSYGGALLKLGARQEAIENYKKSVELNPFNENGVKVLNDLGVPTDGLTPFGTALLHQGSKGPEVSALQEALNSKLNPSPGLTVNGDFGSRTEAAVIQFQRQARIAVDGLVGPQTMAALLAADVDPYFVESSGISSSTGPQVITRNVLQDSRGDFWLATWHGIIRYDGTTFTNVTNKEGLRRYRAFSLLEDHQDNIWLGTTGAGAYRYDGSSYTNYTTKDGLVDDTILSMLQDSDNNIWFGGMGLTKYDGTTFTSFTEEDDFTSSDVHSLSQAPDGSLWFGTRGALFHYDGETFVNFTEKHGVSIERNSYTPALIDRRGHVWFGGSKGIYHYDGERVLHLFEPACFSLMEDSHGNIWFVGGALKGEGPKPGTSVFNRFDPAAGLENILAAREQIEVKAGAIFGLTEDKDGNIWFGTGHGIGRIDGDAVQYYQPHAWGPGQATGAPDTATAGDQATAWATQEPDAGTEWLKLTYAQAVDVAQVRVHETFNPGAVTSITAAAEGGEVVIWSGDPVAAEAPNWLELTPTAAARTATITLHLDTTLKEGWNEIDAVELVGADGSRQWAEKAESSSFFGQ
jgi:peptidoglycan hydrolase-like protein with peptidoglycan-binding domain